MEFIPIIPNLNPMQKFYQLQSAHAQHGIQVFHTYHAGESCDKVELTDKPESCDKVELTNTPESCDKVELTDKPESCGKVELTDKPESCAKVELTDKPESRDKVLTSELADKSEAHTQAPAHEDGGEPLVCVSGSLPTP
eukprot:NODE_2770_length_645_cov_40.062081_g2297_i0.p1 GENE.NODE_2770_length_645_cov_40.062081_g2297_i0~~NODE_2770_length_645_cov_40.062081_g2297_i0.p1  ORF type:complete len:139 (-),score=12.74 NODE_2770_length_645_cov_40.062081_g2297_i0:94-510(-)